MPQTLQREHTAMERLPDLFRSRTLDYTMMVLGAVVAAFGAYTYFAPTDWFWADLGEAWYFTSWIVGGALLAGAFGLLGASLRDRAGHWTPAAIASFVVGLLAVAGAVAAAVVWIV